MANRLKFGTKTEAFTIRIPSDRKQEAIEAIHKALKKFEVNR